MMTDAMMTQHNEETAVATIERNPAQLIELAINKGCDPDHLGKLMDLAERWEANRAAEEFGTALAKFQSECPVIHKKRGVALERGGSPSYYYASLDDIMYAIRPLLSATGMSVTFSEEFGDKGLTITCKVRRGRHVEESKLTVPVPSQMRVNDTQKMGAALSYAKRYALCAALNIQVSDEDRDAVAMVDTITDEQALEIEALVKDCGRDVGKFCQWARVEKVADIPAAKFAGIVKQLKAWVREANK